MDKHLFLGANTPDGFIHHFDKIIEMFNLKKLFILKGGNGVGKSTFIKNFATAFEDYSVTYIYCPADPTSLDGIIIESLGIDVIDGTAPHIVDPRYPGVIDEIVNLGEFIIPSRLEIKREQLEIINKKKRDLYKRAFDSLDRARAHHKRIEQFYKDAVDFSSASALCNKLIASSKIDAGIINRNPPFENSIK